MLTNKQSPRDGLEAIQAALDEMRRNVYPQPDKPESAWAKWQAANVALEAIRTSHPNAAEPVAWRCFHCDDTFHSEAKAREHFGPHEGRTPACQIKGSEGGLIRALREAEEEAEKAWSAVHSEGAEGLLAYRGNLSRHHAALRSAEETGYEKGLADGRAHPPAPQDNASTDVRGLVEEMKEYLIGPGNKELPDHAEPCGDFTCGDLRRILAALNPAGEA